MRTILTLTQWNRYAVGVSMAILVLVANQLFIQYWLYQKNEDSRIINLSGRQRMLSQKINLGLAGLANRQAGRADYADWKKVHYGMLNGDRDMDIHRIKNQQARQILLQLSANIEYIGRIMESRPAMSPELLAKINRNQAGFLEQMERVVKQLEQDSDNRLRFIQIIEIILAAFSIIIVAAEVRYVYQPAEKELRQAVSKLETSENKLLAILDSTTDCNIFLSRDFEVLDFNRTARENARKFYGREIRCGDDFRKYAKNDKRLGLLFGNVLAGNATSLEHEFESQGVGKWHQVRFFPVYNKRHELIGISYNSTDIDQKKRAEMKIKDQLGVFREIAWQQSHTVRAPVANILGILDLMNSHEEKTSDREKAEYLRLINDQATKLDGIIHDIVQKTDYMHE